jgi:hypothetical protein
MKSTIAKIICLMVLGISGLYAQIPITLTPSLPANVDNKSKQFFRPMFSQQGESCGNANGIGFAFTYEMDCARNVSANSAANQYPYSHTYHFLNDGSQNNGTSHMYVDAFNIVRENGIPNVADYGGITSGFPTKWLSGYDLWYKAIQNRVDKIDTIGTLDTLGLRKVKQWVYDHGNGSPNGGVANFGCSAVGWQEGTIASGVEAGKTILTSYGISANGDHAQTICGYNDSIRNDVNKDGKFTKNVDVNNDGKVDLADWELGAFLVANSWGTIYFDGGFYYAPYRLFAMTMAQGGIMNSNRVCIVTVKPEYTPRLTLKTSITHSQRNQIALSVGVAPDQEATEPTKTRLYKHQFNYAGGAFPMCGQNQSTTIELGLDVTDLLDSIPGATQAKFFLVVKSKGGTGMVNSLSLLDYSSNAVPVETKSTQMNVSIIAETYIGVTYASSLVHNSKKTGGHRRIAVRSVRGIVQVRLPVSDAAEVSFFNMEGKRIVFPVSATSTEWMDIPRDIRPGMYMVYIKTARDESWTGRVHFLK